MFIYNWTPYPKYKPPSGMPLLITVKWADDNYEIQIAEYYDDITIPVEDGFGYLDEYITAWALLPPPYGTT